MAKRQDPLPAGGIYAALLTPRKPGTTVADAAALLDYLDCAVNAGVDGIVLFGATGEFIHFDPEERARSGTLAVRRSRVPALINVSHSTIVGTIALAESAMKVGAAGLLLMPPYFYRYGEEDIFAFYQEIAAVLDGEIALYIYNLPAFTNPLSFELIKKILGLRGFVGIKDSSGDLALLVQLQDLRSHYDYRLLSGNENLYLDARLGGADGAVSGIAAALPELMVALDRAIVSLDQQKAAILQNRLREFMQWVRELPPVTAIKETAAFRCWCKNEPALPNSPETADKIAQLQSWLATWLPLMLADCASVGS